MKQAWKRVLFALLGVMGLLSLLCSIAAACVTNTDLITRGFNSFADGKSFGVPASEYPTYAKAIAQYLDGKTDAVQVPAREDHTQLVNAFSETESLHLQDVRSIVSTLKLIRWIAGGGTVAALAALYLLAKNREKAMQDAFRGFAAGSILLLAAGLGLAAWGMVNFNGLFWTFHQVVFSNDLWLMNPGTDLLVALMPLSFFRWYGTVLLKNLLPVLGIMLAIIIAWFKVGRKEEKAA